MQQKLAFCDFVQEATEDNDIWDEREDLWCWKAHDLGHLHPSLVPSRVKWCMDLDDLELAQGLKSETCDFSPFRPKKRVKLTAPKGLCNRLAGLTGHVACNDGARWWRQDGRECRLRVGNSGNSNSRMLEWWESGNSDFGFPCRLFGICQLE